jgi:NADPH-dependent ferric siderophore reductase
VPITQAAVERNAMRTRRRYFVTTVAARHRVSANTVRFTLAAPEFGDFRPLGSDEFFALVIPRPGRAFPALDIEDDEDPRTALNAMPDAIRPDIRWYTVRRHRPSLAEIDVDIVLHGESGPASRLATHARPGDQVGFREASAAYLPEADGHQLLIADETALPALSAILECAPGLDASVIIEVPYAEDLPPIATDLDLRVLTRGAARPGSLAVEAAAAVARERELGYAWVCGERATATETRRRLVDQGVDKDMIMFSGYWRLGEARR